MSGSLWRYSSALAAVIERGGLLGVWPLEHSLRGGSRAVAQGQRAWCTPTRACVCSGRRLEGRSPPLLVDTLLKILQYCLIQNRNF